MTTLNNLGHFKNIHMIGIGGTSMSGIAEILNFWNFKVTGSDASDSENIEKLLDHNIPVTIGHDLEMVEKADIVIYTAAIAINDPELVRARELNIPTIERADFLGEITKAFSDTICVSGTHGKTTTTSMISTCFIEGKMDPTVQVGAILKQLNGNYRIGNSEFFILEACEYVESFLKFAPKTEVILNIDNDHLDYFKDLNHIISAFEKYVKLLPKNGLLVINGDDKNCLNLSRLTSARSVTFGIENQKSNFVARNINFDSNGFPSFDIYYNDTFYKTVKLSVPGRHNIMNSLACTAVCHMYGLSKDTIKNGLFSFTGANRRFEFIGKFNNNISVFDDYAHHPTEIDATYSAMKGKKYNQSWVVFQPHTYSRTKNLLPDFVKSLKEFDNIIITDIYAAREKNTFNISSQDLVNALNEGGKNALFISDFDDIVKYVRTHACNNDILLTMGAGTVTNISKMIIDK